MDESRPEMPESYRREWDRLVRFRALGRGRWIFFYGILLWAVPAYTLGAAACIGGAYLDARPDQKVDAALRFSRIFAIFSPMVPVFGWAYGAIIWKLNQDRYHQLLAYRRNVPAEDRSLKTHMKLDKTSDPQGIQTDASPRGTDGPWSKDVKP